MTSHWRTQNCPERETQVASDLPSEMKQLCGLEFMTDARILSYGPRIFSQGWMDIFVHFKTTEEGHEHIVLDHLVSTCFVFGKSYSLLLGPRFMFSKLWRINDDCRWILNCSIVFVYSHTVIVNNRWLYLIYYLAI